ncbi:MAG: hypothetical protein LBG15_07200, partial [Dysgonamonadaceae bacterium]|nr:hypothetical protein [Dysgonamonadaceae bacterium]
MKKAALVLILTVFTSCVPGRMGYHTNTYIIDYSVFTEKGFFVSESNSVSFDYRPLGSLHVTVYSGKVPGVKKLAEKKLIKKSEDDIYPDTYESEDKTW